MVLLRVEVLLELEKGVSGLGAGDGGGQVAEDDFDSDHALVGLADGAVDEGEVSVLPLIVVVGVSDPGELLEVVEELVGVVLGDLEAFLDLAVNQGQVRFGILGDEGLDGGDTLALVVQAIDSHHADTLGQVSEVLDVVGDVGACGGDQQGGDEGEGSDHGLSNGSGADQVDPYSEDV